MYQIYRDVILRKDFKLPKILKKIDEHHAEEVLTDSERDRLRALIVNTSDTPNDPEIIKIFEELEPEGGEPDERSN